MNNKFSISRADTIPYLPLCFVKDSRKTYLQGMFIFFMILCLGCTPQKQDNAAAEAAKTNNESRVLIAASNMSHPPFSSWDENGNAVGIEVDIVEQAARTLGYKVKWVEKPFGELFDAIENGEIDVAVSTIGITEERKKKVAFSDPYFETQIIALVRDEEGSPRSLAELEGRSIGVDKGTSAYPKAKEQWSSVTLIESVITDMTWQQMLIEKKIDAFVVDASDQKRLEEQSGFSFFKIEEPLSKEYFGVIMNLEAGDLREAINEVISSRVNREKAS